MAQDKKKQDQVEEERSPFVVHEEPGECRHGMVPEWCAICSPRDDSGAGRGVKR